MTRFVVWRLLIAIPVLLGVSIVAFLIIHLIPGNPAQAMLCARRCGFSNTALSVLKMAVVAPMPRARVAIAARGNAGAF